MKEHDPDQLTPGTQLDSDPGLHQNPLVLIGRQHG